MESGTLAAEDFATATIHGSSGGANRPQRAARERGARRAGAIDAAIACLFVVVDYLCAKKNFRPDVGTGIASDAAIDRALTRLLPLLPDRI